MSSSSTAPSYFPHMDALRVLAVSMVLVHHWSPQHSLFWFNAEMGVQLFFVISGFLISGILLDARARAEAQDRPRGSVLRRFYLRRVLRIFPVYYLTLAVTWLAGVESVRDSLGWHLTYLSNAFFASRGAWHGHVTHFWSLAVEEQFYLAWPWLLLFLPRRALLPAILAALGIAPLFRILGAAAGLHPIAIDVTPLGSLDTLGMGALLALLRRHPSYEPRLWSWLLPLGVIAALGYAGIRAVEGTLLPLALAEPLRRLLLPLALGLVVLASARGIPGPLGRLMILPPILWLGRISYGLYLFHNFMSLLLWRVWTGLGLSYESIDGTGWDFLAKSVLLVSCAALSWHLFEKPINDLKSRVDYVRSGSSA